MMIALLILILIILGIALFLRTPVFGSPASGTRLKRIEASPNYRKGQFQNSSFTPNLKEGTSMVSVFKDFFFNRSPRNKPSTILPSKKTNLLTLDPNENVLVWFGHSSYYFQADGKKFLVDPVFSGHASPFSFTTNSFPGSDVYRVDDLPFIDFLLLSHDHYDHLDYTTIIKLKDKVGHIITGLGTGAHLERWGFAPAQITELDWEESTSFAEGFTLTATPARHFSGRTLKPNSVLWCSFVLQTPTLRLFIGGDSGYDTHFKKIGETYGPFDLAIMECGQYNEYWKYIHTMPEEMIQAAKELNAKKILPVHWAKFALALHAWDEPINRAETAAQQQGMPILTPMIGEKLYLDKEQSFDAWWKKVS